MTRSSLIAHTWCVKWSVIVLLELGIYENFTQIRSHESGRKSPTPILPITLCVETTRTSTKIQLSDYHSTPPHNCPYTSNHRGQWSLIPSRSQRVQSYCLWNLRWSDLYEPSPNLMARRLQSLLLAPLSQHHHQFELPKVYQHTPSLYSSSAFLQDYIQLFKKCWRFP